MRTSIARVIDLRSQPTGSVLRCYFDSRNSRAASYAGAMVHWFRPAGGDGPLLVDLIACALCGSVPGSASGGARTFPDAAEARSLMQAVVWLARVHKEMQHPTQKQETRRKAHKGRRCGQGYSVGGASLGVDIFFR